MPNLIPGADADIVKPLHRKLTKQFSSILLSTKVKSVKPNKDDSVNVTIENDNGAKVIIRIINGLDRKNPNNGVEIWK